MIGTLSSIYDAISKISGFCADIGETQSQSNILKQAGVAVLAQANQSPGAAVRLLG